MENHTIVQLKAIVKERGIKGFYKFRKAELIHALEGTRLLQQKVIYFISRFQMIPLQFYNQHPGDHQNFAVKSKQNIKNFVAKGMQKIKDFGNWLLSYISPKPKVVDKVLESFKNKIKKRMKRETLPFN